MSKKIALDWDEQQVRLVVAESDSRRTRIVDAAIVPIGDGGLNQALAKVIRERNLDKADCFVAVGRDRAELRQMQFPPVPTEELPDMVRFQAIRSFAAAGDSATVDFLPTTRDAKGVSAIVAASAPGKLDPIRKSIESSGLKLARIVVRPIAAAALFELKDAEFLKSRNPDQTIALIDLVADEAEIAMFRGSELVFVRSVRLPNAPEARVTALAGEVRRSQMACGSGSGASCDIVMWGTPARHGQELAMIAKALADANDQPPKTRLLDPFTLVDADANVQQGIGETVGRLAPLIGLLVADAGHADRLIDFANPRRKAEHRTDRRKIGLAVGVPAAIVLVMGWVLYSRMRALDSRIAAQTAANNLLRQDAKLADASVLKTERIDAFMDGDVNWLDEIVRLSTAMPPADKLILKSVSGTVDQRLGGGKLVVAGLVTSPSVIENMEASLRDENHRVVGDGSSSADAKETYRWQIRETITIEPSVVRSQRYKGMNQ